MNVRPLQAGILLSTAVEYRFSWQTNSIFQMVSIRIPLPIFIFISCKSCVLISYLQRRFFNNSNMEQLSSSLCLLPFLRFRVRSFPHFPLEANPFFLPESDHHCKLLCYAFLTHRQLTGAVYVWFSLIRECSKIKGIDILEVWRIFIILNMRKQTTPRDRPLVFVSGSRNHWKH